MVVGESFLNGTSIVDYNYKLLPAEVVRVYNKIIVDARLDNGDVVAAFCGAPEIAEMCVSGSRLWLKRTSRGKRLVKYNISFVQTPEGLVFANPRYNRQLFQEAFHNGVLADFKEYSSCKLLSTDENVNGLDFELTNDAGKKCFVFVVPLYSKKDGCVVFPRNISFFEMKMIEEMKRRKQNGADTYVFMIVPREDCCSAKFIWSADTQGAALVFEAAENGLNFLCYGCKIAKNRIEITHKLNIVY